MGDHVGLFDDFFDHRFLLEHYHLISRSRLVVYENGHFATTLRGYVKILSALTIRMEEFDRDADAKQIIDKVQVFCVQLTSACSLGQECPIMGSRLMEFESDYLCFKDEMECFLRLGGRVGNVHDPEVHEGTGDAMASSSSGP